VGFVTNTENPVIVPADLVGEFFVSSWGYDQTNIDFYKVVAATAKCIKVQEWSGRRDEQNRLVPGDGPRTFWSRSYDYDTGLHGDPVSTVAKVQLKRIASGWQGEPWITLTTYSGASKWDGRPMSDTYTHGGMGH
jgi:hypothetical protein